METKIEWQDSNEDDQQKADAKPSSGDVWLDHPKWVNAKYRVGKGCHRLVSANPKVSQTVSSSSSDSKLTSRPPSLVELPPPSLSKSTQPLTPCLQAEPPKVTCTTNGLPSTTHTVCMGCQSSLHQPWVPPALHPPQLGK